MYFAFRKKEGGEKRGIKKGKKMTNFLICEMQIKKKTGSFKEL